VALLLITGIPGTGKTTLGNYLAEHHGFRHLDFETGALARFWRFGERGFRARLAAAKRRTRNIVVTWGFVPDSQLDMVRAMRSLGFDWIWLDGDRAAARRAFIARGTVSVQMLDAQMERIAEHIDLATLRPRIVDPFDSAGRFRPLEEVAAELIRA
jgi:hypothetical protein